MLLSYPAIESYLVSCYREESHLLQFGLGADLKAFVGANRDIQINRLTDANLICAGQELLSYLISKDIQFQLDTPGKTNQSIHHKQKAFYDSSSEYRLLSLLSIAFLQLGILEMGQAP